MSKVLDFELITPEGILLENKITELYATTDTGEVGILYNHANFKSKLGKAPVRYTLINGDKESVSVNGGILEVDNNRITILTDLAEKISKN
jgi:F-type H+-transporting ATPase subunit epsilon